MEDAADIRIIILSLLFGRNIRGKHSLYRYKYTLYIMGIYPCNNRIGLLFYLVNENFSEIPKSLVDVGYDDADTTGILV